MPAGGNKEQLMAVLLDRHGRTFAAEVGIRVERNRPAELFQLLCLSLLISARIRASVAVTAERALIQHGWKTPASLARASWKERTAVLNSSGYARYDESTSRYLGSTAELVLDRYHGDLRRLRSTAEGTIDELLAGLTACPGIGAVGASFFAREVQDTWPEFAPFMDDRARESASELGLPSEPHRLMALAGDATCATVVAALDRAALARGIASIIDAADGEHPA